MAKVISLFLFGGSLVRGIIKTLEFDNASTTRPLIIVALAGRQRDDGGV